MHKMLSPDEMSQAYTKHEQEGRADSPYILEYTNGSNHLTFFGSIHTSEVDSPQWAELDGAWAAFLRHDNPNKILLYEKQGTDEDLLKNEMITKHGESGYAVWLARQSNVPAESPEPDKAKEVEYLRESGHSDADIMIYYFSRQMHQWARQDKEEQPDWQKYAADAVNKYNSLNCWNKEFDLPTVLNWFKDATGKDFNQNDEKTLYDLSDPTQNPVSAESGNYRDVALNEAIQAQMNAGKDVFVVYGSGHAIRLEPVLDDLYK